MTFKRQWLLHMFCNTRWLTFMDKFPVGETSLLSNVLLGTLVFNRQQHDDILHKLQSEQ